MTRFNRGLAIHYQNISTTVAQAKANFAVSCDQCCMDPSCMWNDCGRCRVAQRHKDKVEELRSEAKREAVMA